MAVWLIRAGKYGEFEQKFLQEGRAYLCWDGLDVDLMPLTDRDELFTVLQGRYETEKPRTVSNWRNQIWTFVNRIQPGDLVVLPLKSQPAIQIGEITGKYKFEPSGPDPYFHWRAVDWITDPVPRVNFGQDLLNSFGAFLTICQITRNDAEARIEAMRQGGWKPEKLADVISVSSDTSDSASDEAGVDGDLEVRANDQIARAVNARLKGHYLTRLVDSVLRAQGYTTYVSPEGPDGGADILAGAGPLGFDRPRICVEVKSGDSPIDRPTVDRLIGAMQKFGAEEGLFVSWSGFKSNVRKELAGQFFNVRLWSRDEILEQVFTHYEHLDDEIKAELPLKRIWTLALPEQP